MKKQKGERRKEQNRKEKEREIIVVSNCGFYEKGGAWRK